jgi:hypothetical protein
MNDRTTTADLGCFNKTCAQERHRNIGEKKIEQVPITRKKRLPGICERPGFAVRGKSYRQP